MKWWNMWRLTQPASSMRVVLEAARIVVPDALQLRAVGQDVEQLVGLRLVLDHRERDVGVAEDVDHLLRDGILVERHRDRAEGLRRGKRPVEAGTVGADD